LSLFGNKPFYRFARDIGIVIAWALRETSAAVTI
jgi:hypothetical protein